MEITIRDAAAVDVPELQRLDPLASDGDAARSTAIRQWVDSSSTRVAQMNAEIVGYCVVECTFFGEAFITMLMVAEAARGQGIGTRLMLDAQRRRKTAKLFTSTNLSNQRMQRLLARHGWRSVGIVYGLDDGDPELFFLAPADRLRPS